MIGLPPRRNEDHTNSEPVYPKPNRPFLEVRFSSHEWMSFGGKVTVRACAR